MIKKIHHFIQNINNLFVTFLVFLETAIKRCFFKSIFIFYDFMILNEIMVRDEEHLHNAILLILIKHLLMFASVLIQFISC